MRVFIAFWRWIKSWFTDHDRPLRTIEIEELPETYESDTVYLVGENGHLWSVAMVCPCGCHQLIQLNLVSPRRPRWAAEVHADGTVSLSPSVWRKSGCRSHFWLRRSRIFWCNEDAIHPKRTCQTVADTQ